MGRAARVQVDILGLPHVIENVHIRSFQSIPSGTDTATERITLEFDRF